VTAILRQLQRQGENKVAGRKLCGGGKRGAPGSPSAISAHKSAVISYAAARLVDQNNDAFE